MKQKTILLFSIFACIAIVLIIVIYIKTTVSATNYQWFTTEKQAVNSLLKNNDYIDKTLKGTGYVNGEKVIPYYFHSHKINHGFGTIVIERKNGKYHADKGSGEIGANKLSNGTNGVIKFKTPKKQKYELRFGYDKIPYSEKVSGNKSVIGYFKQNKIYYILEAK